MLLLKKICVSTVQIFRFYFYFFSSPRLHFFSKSPVKLKIKKTVALNSKNCEILNLLQIYNNDQKSKFMLTYNVYVFSRQIQWYGGSHAYYAKLWCIEGRRGHLQFNTFSRSKEVCLLKVIPGEAGFRTDCFKIWVYNTKDIILQTSTVASCPPGMCLLSI